MITVRRILLGEATLYREMRLASLADSPAAFGSSYSEALARSDASWRRQADEAAVGSDRATFFAFHRDAAVGIVSLYRSPDTQAAGELLQMWINPANRGSELSQQLMSGVLDWAAANRFREIRADVAESNARAIRYYQKHGFESAGYGSAFDQEGRTALLLIRTWPAVSARRRARKA